MTVEALLPKRAEIVERRRLTDDVEAYVFRPLEESFSCLPGQFNMLGLPGLFEASLSFSAPCDGEFFEHTVRLAGNLTRALRHRLEPGMEVTYRGPYGTSWPLAEAAGRPLLVIAGGIGIAPLRPVILEALRGGPAEVTLIYGARRPAELIFREELEALQETGLRLHLTVDEVPAGEEWDGSVGFVTEQLDDGIDYGTAVTMCCGPELMMRFVSRLAMRHGQAAGNIHVSMERRMRCGFGHCGHCQVGALFVCKDGPVISYDRVAGYMDTLL